MREFVLGSSNGNKQVFNADFALFPNITQAERDSILAQKGMVVYNTDTETLQGFNGTVWLDLPNTNQDKSHWSHFAYIPNSNITANSYFSSGENINTFQCPFIVPCDCSIKMLSTRVNSLSSATQWALDIHRNGVSVYTVNITTQKHFLSNLSIAFDAGDEISLRVINIIGGSIDRPCVTINLSQL